MGESGFNAHYICSFCQNIVPKEDILFFNSKPVCRDGDCLTKLKGGTYEQVPYTEHLPDDYDGGDCW